MQFDSAQKFKKNIGSRSETPVAHLMWSLMLSMNSAYQRLWINLMRKQNERGMNLWPMELHWVIVI